MSSPLLSGLVSWRLSRVLKLEVVRRFFELFDKYGGYKSGKLKLKKPKQLQVRSSSLSHDPPLLSAVATD